MARRNKAKSDDEAQRFSKYVQEVNDSKLVALTLLLIRCHVFEGWLKKLYYSNASVTFHFRFGAQESNPKRRTLSASPSCLRTSWRWSTWSAPSWWLCANCWSCSLLAPTTCCAFSWWWNSEPSSRTMRWDWKLVTTSLQLWLGEIHKGCKTKQPLIISGDITDWV